MQAAGKSIVGRRDNNEDAFRVRGDLGLFLVADGMGGHEGGEVASRIVADVLTDCFEESMPKTTAVEGMMSDAILRAVHAVEARAKGHLAEMGSTLAAVVLTAEQALIAHVGDSRVYRMRGGVCECLTHDHSFVNELNARGDSGAELPPRYAAMITRCIAAESNTDPDLLLADTEDGDVFMICSDGLSDVLDDDEICRLLASGKEPEEKVGALLDAAFDAESQDNITCVVVHA